MSDRFDYFVLLANMRTGSNLFENNIRLYDAFSCHGELFNPHFIGYPNTETQFGITLQDREHHPIKVIEQMVQTSSDFPGFRLFSDHDPRVLAHVLADPRCAKIVLTRNPLDSYVSHEIAKSTDQWKLSDASKRKKAKAVFQSEQFKDYLRRLGGYLAQIRRSLQTTGQTAFYVRYEDLNEVEVYNGLARFLGSDQTMEDLSTKIVRQNPEGLRDKVENYDDMCNALRDLDLLGTEAVPDLQPERNPVSRNIRAGDQVPLLMMPMHRADLPEVSDWLQAHEMALGGDGVQTDLSQKQVGRWLRKHPQRLAMAFVQHPLDRAYSAFYRHIFMGGEDMFRWIRTSLEKNYGMHVPPPETTQDPNRAVLENLGYSVDHHRRAFEVFLEFLKGNLIGQTRQRVDQSWASQVAILQGYSKLCFPDRVVRDEDVHQALAEAETTLGLDPIVLGPREKDTQIFSLQEIYTADIEHACKTVYENDYNMLGFGRWG